MKTLLLFNLTLLLVCFALLQDQSSFRKNKTHPNLEKKYTELYKKIAHHIEEKYVEKRSLEEILKNGLYGLTKSLDPYSTLLSTPKRTYYEDMKTGSYGGVGLHLSKIEEDLVILFVLPGSPSSKLNLKPGDKIKLINSERTEKLSLAQCSEKLKGKKNTYVHLTVKREHEKKTFKVKIKRGDIPLRNVAFSDFIAKDIFYIKINSFSKDIDISLSKAFHISKRANAKSLILDFRGNSGGLLSSSLALLDLIFDKKERILELRGQDGTVLEKHETKNSLHLDKKVKIFALIDKESASASEIVAGALQDLDRAVVIGSQSFGKGLVQKIYNINREISLKITTARYYTPSGRSLQKRDYYKEEEQKDSLFQTRNGRKVEAKGGITPDIEIEPKPYPPFIRALAQKNLFLFFVSTYEKLYELKTPIEIGPEILKNFENYVKNHHLEYYLDGELAYKKFKEELEEKKDSQNIENIQATLGSIDQYYKDLKDSSFDQEENKKWIKRELLGKFSYVLLGQEEEIKQKIKEDSIIKKALEISSNDSLYQSILKPKKF
jgi:carboxyl-terminal processing protease